MSSIINEPIETVLKKYPIDVIDTKNESYKEKKGVWWVRTPNDRKILKKVSNSEITLKHILHAANYLINRGINIPKVIKTIDGSEYVNIDGTCFILIEAIEGKNPSYSSSSELEMTIRELARFHKASEGFFPAPDSKPKYHLGTWIEDYSDQLQDMNKFYIDEMSQSKSNPVGMIIKKEFPYFYDRGIKVIEALKGSEYNEWVAKAASCGCLCHQDFAAGNLIIHPSGKMYILDIDSLTVDIAARDIRKLLNKIMKKKGKWDLNLTQNILRIYQLENPLSRLQWEVVKLDLMFPHLFIGAMNKYYYKRDKEWSNDKYLERISEMASFERTLNTITDNFQALLP